MPRVEVEPGHGLIPVVLVTGLSASEDRMQEIESGADDFSYSLSQIDVDTPRS